MPLPEWPPAVKGPLSRIGLDALYFWWQEFKSYFSTRIDTDGDITFNQAAKGVILTNAAGTVTKRARLNDAGNGWIFEDV